MLKCPRCKGKLKILDVRETEFNSTIHRVYKCVDENCRTQFKTSEKILFTSLPVDIRERFIYDGERP